MTAKTAQFLRELLANLLRDFCLQGFLLFIEKEFFFKKNEYQRITGSRMIGSFINCQQKSTHCSSLKAIKSTRVLKFNELCCFYACD